MTRSLVFFSILTLLAGCGDSTGSGGSGGTGGSAPLDVVIDTFNVALAGAFIPFEAERRQPIVDAIAASDSDILCLQEVWTQADKEMIRDAALTAYPHSAFFEDNLETPLDDATDQQGEIPPPPTGVPCPDVDVGDDNILDQMNAAVDCVRDNCSTIPDSEEGRTTSAGCAASSCVPAVAGLLFGNTEQQRCYACVITQLPTETFGFMRDSCATNDKQDMAFRGQNGLMILSRHPITNAEELVVPGTWNRRTFLKATVELPNGAELDTYCNHLTPIFAVGEFEINTFPYTGQYGDGTTGPSAWQAEQELQAEKLITYVTNTSGSRPAVILGDLNYVTNTSGSRPAVILGDLNAGHAFADEGIVAEGEPTLDLLESAFVPAYTADFTPICTFCSTNPVTNPDSDPDFSSVWIDHIQLHNLTADSVVSTERIYDEDVVPVDGQMVPLSDHFGMRSVITVP
jgi:endonuclease/exonuclease/phosphatase family metal-dependent hydrolase